MIYLTAIYRFLGIRGCIAVGLAMALAFAMWRADGLSTKLERARDQISAMEVASEAARAAQQAVNDAAAARYQELAERASDDHETTRIVVRDATDRFIADNGVRPDGQCVPGNTDSAAEGGSASVPVAMPTSVVMDTADVRACGDLYAYALSAHEWARGLAGEP
jgi:hypothetical protein